METLKVKFVDFWVDIDKPERNFFYDALSENYRVEFSDDPDIVFYSCFGEEHLKYTCTRIFYSPENWRPDFCRCDYAITFDRLEDARHLRLPLWALYFSKDLILQEDPAVRYEDWAGRKHFCCIIVSNANAGERIAFYHKLNEKLQVDSAGKWNNTIGKPLLPGTDQKLNFIKDYRFVISFENASHSGYTTEKIIEPLMAGCIPIYWGDPDVGQDLNLRRFINIGDAGEYDASIERILAIENDHSMAKAMLGEPIFPGDQEPPCLRPDYLGKKLFAWVEEAKAGKFKGVGGQLRERVRYFSRVCKGGLRTIKNKIIS